jgi:hypothetical protein
MKSAGCNRGVTLRGLYGDVAKKELNLLQFAAGGTAEPGATPTEVVGRDFADTNLGGELLHDMPHEPFRYRFAPDSPCATHAPEKAARANSCGPCPVSKRPRTQSGRGWSERDRPFHAGL